MINFLSLNSQANSSRKPFKKLHSQRIFQRFYHLAHTRLRRIQNFRCITERPSLRTCHEILQLFQIHKTSLFHPEKPVSAISFSDGSSCFPFIISKFHFLSSGFFLSLRQSLIQKSSAYSQLKQGAYLIQLKTSRDSRLLNSYKTSKNNSGISQKQDIHILLFTFPALMVHNNRTQLHRHPSGM